jgi:hypothetical protein
MTHDATLDAYSFGYDRGLYEDAPLSLASAALVMPEEIQPPHQIHYLQGWEDGNRNRNHRMEAAE